MTQPQNLYREAFANALNELLDRHGVPASNFGRLQALAELVNRSTSTCHRWLTGKGLPDLEDQFLLCNIFACSLDELLGRIPVMRESIDRDQYTTFNYFSDSGKVPIQIPTCFFSLDEVPHEVGVMWVHGNEMLGYASPNDRIFFALDDTRIISGSVYVLRINGKLAIRRLRIRINQQIDVICDNPVFPLETLPMEMLTSPEDGKGIVVMGRVIAKYVREPKP